MSSRPSSLRLRIGWWAVLVVLAGLVAMHGLGTHGTTGAVHDAAARVSHPVHVTTGVTVPAVASALVSSSPASGHGMGRMAMDCLVVLTLALLLWAGAVVRRGWQVALPASHRHLTRVRRRGRDPDPPDLATLSIRRC